MKPNINAFFDSATWTVSYIVFDEPGGICAIIDPVLDYDPKSSRTSTRSADKLIALIQEQRLSVEWILETHAHADHLSSADYLKNRMGEKLELAVIFLSCRRLSREFSISMTLSFQMAIILITYLLKASYFRLGN